MCFFPVKNAEQQGYSVDATRLGLRAKGIIRDLFYVKDNNGTVPLRTRVIAEFARDCGGGAESKFSYAQIDTIYEVLTECGGQMKEASDVGGLLDKIIDASVPNKERLTLTEAALQFFRQLSKTALINANYPKSGPPEGVRELATSLGLKN